jgi:hypothetical protein
MSHLLRMQHFQAVGAGLRRDPARAHEVKPLALAEKPGSSWWFPMKNGAFTKKNGDFTNNDGELRDWSHKMVISMVIWPNMVIEWDFWRDFRGLNDGLMVVLWESMS